MNSCANQSSFAIGCYPAVTVRYSVSCLPDQQWLRKRVGWRGLLFWHFGGTVLVQNTDRQTASGLATPNINVKFYKSCPIITKGRLPARRHMQTSLRSPTFVWSMLGQKESKRNKEWRRYKLDSAGSRQDPLASSCVYIALKTLVLCNAGKFY